MDNLRFILYFALAFVGLLLYQAWQRDYGTVPPKPPQQVVDNNANQTPTSNQPPTTVSDASPQVAPAVPAPGLSDAASIASPSDPTMVAGKPDRAEFIKVETDLLQVAISKRGGTVEELSLMDYPVNPEAPEVKFKLLRSDTANLYIAQSGLVGSNNNAAPSDTALFTATAMDYRLQSEQDILRVSLTWSEIPGIKVTKEFTFRRGSYLIELQQKIENNSSQPWPIRSYVQLRRTKPSDSKDGSYGSTYTGAAYYNSKDKYKNLSFDNIAKTPYKSESPDGWVAMVQHHFVSAWIPADTFGPRTFFTRVINSTTTPNYDIGMYSPTVLIQPGQTQVFTDKLFAGPKLQKQLATITPGLELTVDYGWLTVIAQPIFWLLDKLHSVFQNWGWAIIFLTIIIKLAFYKLSEASYKSMADMRKLAPKLQELKDRYGENKELLNSAMMELYKKEKINPLGGCLPIVVQIPVFIALYWVLLESVEMRQAPFMLWINNLSEPDPYFVLPLIMGVSMLVQQQLNPAPVDPVQAKVMMLMPFVFTVFFAFFPSGLVVYWVVNNLLSIAQQWYIVRKVESDTEPEPKST